jgi:preprotein translocase subunit SecG
MSILINVLLTIWSIVALLMVLVVLMQRPKSEGLGAAFGGAVTENIFGAQTTNVLVKFTGWLAGIFFVLTFSLSILYAKQTSGDSALRRELLKQQTGAVTTSPSPSPAPTAAAAQTSPIASAAPDSGVGVVPAGSVAPAAAPASAPAESAAPSPEQSAATTTPRPSKRKRKP